VRIPIYFLKLDFLEIRALLSFLIEDSIRMIIVISSHFQGMRGVFDFGDDTNMDPDLALTLRLSLQEVRARQARKLYAREHQEMETRI
jgi:hypothetical protein